MITTAQTHSDPSDAPVGDHHATISPTPGRTPTRRRGSTQQRLIVRITLLVLGLVGFAMVFADASDAEPGAELVEGSSIGDFLQPAGGETIRIKYEQGDEIESIQNGGVIALSNELNVAVSVSPYPPTDFDIAVDLLLTAADGSIVTDATVAATWDMAVMFHGPFHTEFVHIGGGHYTADFDFFMYGPWEITTHITSPTHETPDDLPISIYVWPE